MEKIRNKVIDLQNNCNMLLDIIDGKKEFESESQKILEISKITRKCSVLCYEINRLGVDICFNVAEKIGQKVEEPKKLVSIMDKIFGEVK